VSAIGIVLVALAIAVGLVGIAVPILPGSLLVLAAIAVWAVAERNTVGWIVLAVATAVVAAALIVKYMWPARRMREAQIGGWTLAAGAVLGIVGFFVVPVVGLVLGFVLGVYLAELATYREQRRAWAATVHAVKGVALSVGVELAGGLAATAAWVVGVLLTQ
jgi:uncharacterized protein YqgC (DUF456 family)